MKKLLSICLVISMLFSTYAMAAPAAIQAPETAEETQITATENDDAKETAETATDDLAFLENAQQIYFDDFQSYEKGQTIAKDGSASPATIADGYTATYGSDAGPVLTVQEESDGNKYLNVKKNGTWDMLTVNFPNDLKAEGDYYFVSSFYIADDSSSWFADSAQMTVYTNNKGGDGHLLESYKTTDGMGWRQCVRKVTVVGQTAAEEGGVTFTNGAGNKYTPVAWIDKMYCYSSSKDASNAGNMKLDNLACYFVPAAESVENVTVTFDKNTTDTNATAPEALTIGKMSGIDLSKYAATTTTEGVTFLGWSTSADGNVFPGAYYATENATLYAIWKMPTEQFLIPGFDWEMNEKPSQFGNFSVNSGELNADFGTVDGDATVLKFTPKTPGTKNAKTLTKEGEEAKSLFPTYDVNITTNVNLPAATISKIELCVKLVTPYTERKAGADFQTFYTTDTNTGLSESRSFYTTIPGDGEYHVYSLNIAAASGWNGMIKTFRLDPLNELFAEEELYIDYIKLYTETQVPTEDTAVTFSPANGATELDPRDGAIKITFPSKPKATAAQVAAAMGSEFVGASFDSDTNTFTVSANRATLAGQTISSNGGVIFGNGENYKLPAYSVTYAATAPADGANLLPNGNFDLGMTKMINTGTYVKSATNGIFTIGKASHTSGNMYASTYLEPAAINLTPGTAETPKRYYFEYKARMNPTTFKQYQALQSQTLYNSSGAVVTNKDFLKPRINVYGPKLHGANSSGAPTWWEYPTYIKGIFGSANSGPLSDGNWITRNAVYKVYDTANTTIHLQDVVEGWPSGDIYSDAAHTQKVGYTTGVYFDYDYIILKEMYAIKFAGGEGATGTGPSTAMYYANGLTVKLPSDIGFENEGKGFAGWEYNGKTYVPGDELDLTGVTGDITITATWKNGVAFANGDQSVSVGTITYPYTLPYTVDGISYTGENAENYVLDAWKYGTTVYPTGKVFTAEEADLIEGKTFEAIYTDKTQSAMGFAFEGDNTSGVSGSKMHAPVAFNDNGVSAILASWDNTTTWSGTKYQNDPRMNFTVPTKTGTEFSVFKLRYRVADLVNYTDTDGSGSTYDVATTGEERLYMSGTRGLYSESQRMDVGISHVINVADGYKLFEIDMNKMTNGTDGFIAQGGVKTIWFDPIQVFGGKAYIDYMRMYRAGVHTVSYNTNAPAGTTEVTAVAADTGIGLGKGYMLTGVEPTIDNAKYTFIGWALTPDATVADVVSSIDLVGDATVYGVWATATAPTASANTEIRFPSASVLQGLRFAATVTEEQKANATEYGYIIALTDTLGTNELTFNFTGKYVSGAAYVKDGGLDKIFAMDGTNTIFTGVLTNIPATQYKTSITARPYIKMAVGAKTIIVYGDAVVTSPFDTANEMINAYEGGTLTLTDEELKLLFAMTE